MRLSVSQITTAVVLGIAPLVVAHGAHEAGADAMEMDMGMAHGADEPKAESKSYPPTYFALADHAAIMYAHIGLMVLAWVFVLPIGKFDELWPVILRRLTRDAQL